MLELKNLTLKELNQLLDEKRQEYVKLKIELKLNKTNAVHTVRGLKKEIARVLTQMNENRIMNEFNEVTEVNVSSETNNEIDAKIEDTENESDNSSAKAKENTK